MKLLSYVYLLHSNLLCSVLLCSTQLYCTLLDSTFFCTILRTYLLIWFQNKINSLSYFYQIQRSFLLFYLRGIIEHLYFYRQYLLKHVFLLYFYVTVCYTVALSRV